MGIALTCACILLWLAAGIYAQSKRRTGATFAFMLADPLLSGLVFWQVTVGDAAGEAMGNFFNAVAAGLAASGGLSLAFMALVALLGRSRTSPLLED